MSIQSGTRSGIEGFEFDVCDYAHNLRVLRLAPLHGNGLADGVVPRPVGLCHAAIDDDLFDGVFAGFGSAVLGGEVAATEHGDSHAAEVVVGHDADVGHGLFAWSGGGAVIHMEACGRPRTVQ